MLGLVLSFGVVHAADVFTYVGHWAAPGLRMPSPQAVLSDGRILTAASTGAGLSDICLGTPENGVETMGTIATRTVYEMRAGGTGVWVRGAASFDHYAANLSPIVSALPAPEVGVDDLAVDAQDRLYLLDEVWDGTRVDVYAGDGTALGTWALDFAWTDWRAWATCFDATGRLCVLVTHGSAYSIIAYDLTAGPTQPAAGVEIATGSLDAWGKGQSAHALAVARMAAAPGTSRAFIVASVSDAGGALLSVSATTTSVLYQASAWYYFWHLAADPSRGAVWAVADGLFRIDSPTSCAYVGSKGFDSPGTGLADVVSLAAGTAGLAANDFANARLTFLDATGAASSHYDLWLPEGPIALNAAGTALYAVDLGPDGGLVKLDVGTWQIHSLPWAAAYWLEATPTHLWIVPPLATVVAVCLDPTTGLEARRADLGLTPDGVADLAVAPDESGFAALTTDSHVVLFDGSGLQVGEWALPAGLSGRRITFAGASQIAVAVVGTGSLQVIGFSLQGNIAWGLTLPSGLPANPWHVADPLRPNEFGGLAADPSGQRVFVADNLHGVIHRLTLGQAGDVNGDGVVDRADFVALIQQWEGRTRTPYVPQTQGLSTIDADLNGDGRLDHADTQILLEKLLQSGGL
jgi:hypothetical protein